MQPQKALLIIDMQKGSFTDKTPRYDTSGVVKRINKLAEIFRKSRFPVIFIQHDGSSENAFIPNTHDWKLLDQLNVESNDLFIDKIANDAFYQSRLHQKLTELNVKELFITGCATDFCVESTLQSALTKDYHVTAIEDSHTTGDRPHLKAEQVIEHYNWVWRYMIPTKGKIEVMKADDVISLIETTRLN